MGGRGGREELCEDGEEKRKINRKNDKRTDNQATRPEKIYIKGFRENRKKIVVSLNKVDKRKFTSAMTLSA